MSDRGKRPAGGFRAPSTNGAKDKAAPSRGLLDRVFAPRSVGGASMPGLFASLGRGFVAVVSSPVLLVAIPVILIAEWLGAVALGFQGPFTLFASALAVPPVGTAFDESIATGIFGQQTGLVLLLAFVALRAIVLAFVITITVEVLEEGKSTRAALGRGLRVIPTTLAVGIIAMALITFSSILLAFLGSGIGFLLQIATLVITVYLFVFAPIMAAAEGRSMPESLSRSIRAARMPGAGNLTIASLYTIVSVVVLLVTGRPDHLGVNPSIGEWAFVLLANLVQVVFLATFAFRYLSVTEEVPAAPEPKRRAPRGARRR
jgi:hypothetical protein